MAFVIAGGGPTGFELAGAIAELARLGMIGEFNNYRSPRHVHHHGAIGTADPARHARRLVQKRT